MAYGIGPRPQCRFLPALEPGSIPRQRQAAAKAAADCGSLMQQRVDLGHCHAASRANSVARLSAAADSTSACNTSCCVALLASYCASSQLTKVVRRLSVHFVTSARQSREDSSRRKANRVASAFSARTSPRSPRMASASAPPEPRKVAFAGPRHSTRPPPIQPPFTAQTVDRRGSCRRTSGSPARTACR